MFEPLGWCAAPRRTLSGVGIASTRGDGDGARRFVDEPGPVDTAADDGVDDRPERVVEGAGQGHGQAVPVNVGPLPLELWMLAHEEFGHGGAVQRRQLPCRAAEV